MTPAEEAKKKLRNGFAMQLKFLTISGRPEKDVLNDLVEMAMEYASQGYKAPSDEEEPLTDEIKKLENRLEFYVCKQGGAIFDKESWNGAVAEYLVNCCQHALQDVLRDRLLSSPSRQNETKSQGDSLEDVVLTYLRGIQDGIDVLSKEEFKKRVSDAIDSVKWFAARFRNRTSGLSSPPQDKTFQKNGNYYRTKIDNELWRAKKAFYDSILAISPEYERGCDITWERVEETLKDFWKDNKTDTKSKQRLAQINTEQRLQSPKPLNPNPETK